MMKLSIHSSFPIENPCYSVEIGVEEIVVIGSTGYLLIRTTDEQTVSQARPVPYQNSMRPTSIVVLPNQDQRSMGFVIGSDDGSLHFCSKNGNVTKTIKCHEGAVLSLACSQDGSFLVSGGEEGLIKVWSRNGTLKAVVAESSTSIFSVVCGPGSKQIAYTSGKNIVLQNFEDGSNSVLKGHWKPVNTLSWSYVTNNLLSGSDDGTYRIWSREGDCLYKSKPIQHGFYQVTWSPRGKYGLVVSKVEVMLIAESGIVLSKVNLDNINHVEWSLDGLQAYCSRRDFTKLVCTGKCIKTRLHEAKQSDATRLVVTDPAMDSPQILDFQATITDYNLAYGYLVVATTNSAFIYSSKNWQLICTLDTKRATLNLLLISQKYTALFGPYGLQMFTCDGKSIGTTSWSLSCYFDQDKAALSTSLLSFTNPMSDSVLLYTDIDSNKKIPERLNNYQKYRHKRPIKTIGTEPASIRAKSTIAFLDQAKELYVLTFAGKIECGCFVINVDMFCWHSDFDIVVLISDKTLHVWGNVQAIPSSIQHLSKPLFSKPIGDTKYDGIIYTDEEVTIIQRNFSEIHHTIPHFIADYAKLISTRGHIELLRLCEQTEEMNLWFNLAVYALLMSELKLAEVALTNVGDYVTLYYIKYLQKLSKKDELRAELALLANDTSLAESIYLGNNSSLDKTVDVNIFSGRWRRASEMAKNMIERSTFSRLLEE